MNKRDSNCGSDGEINGVSDNAEIANIIVTRA